mmetsp:Transcript_32828/g.69049  ORF Transcript_32828/g.69049 Transcript_32828/m.69049 type:complete len:629 (-) Transcript_32828:179-2065(-)
MIEYFRGPYGANLLFRWHGSALAKAFIPGLLSVAIYLALHYYTASSSSSSPADEELYYVNHPYAIGVLVSSVSFLIIFRANYGYQRYWEACTTVHQLMSKWMDAAVFASVFHLQSKHHADMKPPSFFHFDELNELNLTRDREQRESTSSFDNGGSSSSRSEMMMESARSESSKTLRRRRYEKSINETSDTRGYIRTESNAAADHCDETHLLGPPRLDGGWGMLYPNQINGKPTATYYDISNDGKKRQRQRPDGKGFASTQGGRTPSLFLQELVHLSSLLCAVALTTLRNDLDDVESPLDVYIPGQPWPVADPIKLPKDVKRQAYQHRRLSRNIRYLLGMDQTKRSRTIYNAARPMLVIGGVSDNEIAFLQRARGPYAKTQLVWSWLSDFIIREHLAGSMGSVAPPIISRLVQFLSDGMIYYNHARKIMYTPFPFPHAQLSAFFVLMMVVAIPFLMNQYANEVWLGATLSFLTVTCLAGLHEVARELENPFRNAPNDVPLCTLLAFYNEALITTFAGFHPDAYWDQADVLKKRNNGVPSVDEKSDEDDDDDPLLMPELPNIGLNGEEKKAAGMEAPPALPYERPSSAIPQSVDEIDSLKELREMIDSQASKIKELQERVLKRDRPKTAL